MNDADMSVLLSWFLSSFGVGMALAMLLRVFRRVAGYVR